MMVNIENKNGLKGQYNSAQGFGVSQSNNNALRLKSGKKIVRAIRFFKAISLFRTKRCEPSCLPGNSGAQFRPKKVFYPVYRISADGFRYIPFPKALPWARLSWPFRPGFVYKE